MEGNNHINPIRVKSKRKLVIAGYHRHCANVLVRLSQLTNISPCGSLIDVLSDGAVGILIECHRHIDAVIGAGKDLNEVCALGVGVTRPTISGKVCIEEEVILHVVHAEVIAGVLADTSHAHDELTVFLADVLQLVGVWNVVVYVLCARCGLRVSQRLMIQSKRTLVYV